MNKYMNYIFSTLFLSSFLFQCLAFEESDLDPNSSLGQLLTLNLINNALGGKEILIRGKAQDLSVNTPAINNFITASKVSNDYTLDFNAGLIETREGEFLGTFQSDVVGEFEIYSESGLGRYVLDFYQDDGNGLVHIHSEVIDIDSFRNGVQPKIILKSESSNYSVDYNSVSIAPRRSSAYYNLFTDGDIEFVGESNGRSYFSGAIFYPRDLEFVTSPSFQLIKYEYYIFLAYTDNGREWNSIVLKETPLIVQSNGFRFAGFYLTQGEIIGLLNREVSGITEIARYRIPISNPDSYTFSQLNYNPVIANFNNINTLRDPNSVFNNGLIYEEYNTFNERFFAFTSDFFQSNPILLDASDFNSPFNSLSLNSGSFTIHNNLFTRIYPNSDDQGSIKFMNSTLNEFNGTGYSLTAGGLAGSSICGLNSFTIYCAELNTTEDSGRVSGASIQIPFDTANVVQVPNNTAIAINPNGQLIYRGVVNTNEATLISIVSNNSIAESARYFQFRLQHSNSQLEAVPLPPRFKDAPYILNRDATVSQGIGTHRGTFLQFTRERNIIPGQVNPQQQRQPFITSSRSSDGRSWTEPVRLDIRPPRL